MGRRDCYCGATAISPFDKLRACPDARRGKLFGDVRATYRRDADFSLQTQYRFTGQRLEQRLSAPEGGLDRGLYFYGLRWYDSSLGRFIQADTIVPQPGIRRVEAQRPASCSNLILEDLAGPGGCDRIGPDKDVMVDALLVGGLSLELSEGSA